MLDIGSTVIYYRVDEYRQKDMHVGIVKVIKEDFLLVDVIFRGSIGRVGAYKELIDRRMVTACDNTAAQDLEDLYEEKVKYLKDLEEIKNKTGRESVW